jgi:hypothetical protein
MFSRDGYKIPNVTTFHGVTIIDANSDSLYRDRLRSMEIKVKLNVAPDFVGDVYLTTHQAGTMGDKNTSPLKIAEIAPPIMIEMMASKETIIVGDKSYVSTDFSVAEAYPGALAEGGYIDLRLARSEDLEELTDEEAKVNFARECNVGQPAGSEIDPFGNNGIINGVIKTEIVKASQTRASNIVFGNILIAEEDLAEGKIDLIVGGDAWVETFDPARSEGENDMGFFSAAGIRFKDYVTVEKIEPAPETTVELASDGKTITAAIANDKNYAVTVQLIAATYTKDGKLAEIATSQYITIPAGDRVSDIVVALADETAEKTVKALIWDDQFVPFTQQWLLKEAE